MKKRLGTSAVILILTIAFVLLKQVHSLFFDAFALIISYASLYEVLKVLKLSNKKFDGIILYFVPAIICLIINLVSVVNYFILMLALTVLLILYLLTVEIFIYASDRKNNRTEQNAEKLNAALFDRTKNTMMVFAYPILPLSFLFLLNHLPYEAGYIAIIAIFAIAMLTDSLAYLIGILFGKKKFIPEVSPKKSIAGVVGGFLGGLVGSVACFCLFYFTNWFSILNTIPLANSIVAFAILAIVGSYANQLGDLIASAYKRKAGIKDFSNIFPGHGGFMDRVDGLMFVSVVTYITFVLFIV